MSQVLIKALEEKRYEDVVKILLSGQFDLKIRNAAGQTALHLCTKEDSTILLTITKLLIKHGAYVNDQNLNGQTPLHCATLAGAYLQVRLLVQAHALVSLADANHHTPIDYAFWSNNQRIHSFL